MQVRAGLPIVTFYLGAARLLQPWEGLSQNTFLCPAV